MASILDNYTISYAQNREDIIIAAFFPDVKKGTYIDIGANHPLYHSVTKHFYDKGWRGINYEPNPKLFNQIARHRKGDINLMQGLGESKGELILRVYHSRDGLEGISTFSPTMKEDYASHENADNEQYSDITVPVVTLADSLATTNKKHIHFMKVDVEGYEYEVLAGNDWNKHRPELICIESNHMMRDWRPILDKAKYVKVFSDGLNDYFLAKESLKRNEYFDYAKVFLLTKPIIGFETSEQLRALEQKSKDMLKDIKKKDDQIAVLRQYIHEITPLRKHITRQVKARLQKR